MKCRCGCGRATLPASRTDRRKGWVKGQPTRFLKGHWRPPPKNWSLTDLELGWLTGLLEGEGTFLLTGPPGNKHRVDVRVWMTDRDVVERLAELLGGLSVYEREDRREHRTWSRLYGIQITGYAAAELLLIIRPHMGERRQEQIDRCLAHYPAVAGATA